ncbi:hypothetical protein, partial [Rhizomonospora bruguierae]|uniref:hypothetical protein n=1 Tax=Rhizomonospora bruguierae TaxID=1581705 RepID=UPI001BCB81C8
MTVLGRSWHVAATLAAAVIASTAVTGSAQAAPGLSWSPPTPKQVTGVRVAPVKHNVRPAWTAEAKTVRGNKPIAWPAGGSATVDLTTTATTSRTASTGASRRAGTLPFSVAPVAAAAGGQGNDRTAGAASSVRQATV